ncbi:hypothetical protein KJ975_01445 [Myxococcota bacterium]|nr:hypothetical protein [Myxococcota bacterium]
MSFPISMIPPEPKASAARLVADRVDQLRPGHVVMQALTRNVREKAAAVEDACAPKSEKDLTAQLMIDDRGRDQSFTALTLATEAGSLLPGDPELQEKAQKLLARLVPDTLAFLHDSMHAESTILSERLAYLESDEGAALVRDLKLAPYVDNLKAHMAAYDATFAARKAQKDLRPDQLWTSAVPLDQALRALYATLASLESVPFARECFVDMEPLLAAARAARTRRATPAP